LNEKVLSLLFLLTIGTCSNQPKVIVPTAWPEEMERLPITDYKNVFDEGVQMQWCMLQCHWIWCHTCCHCLKTWSCSI